jgi:hypothetical protein
MARKFACVMVSICCAVPRQALAQPLRKDIGQRTWG